MRIDRFELAAADARKMRHDNDIIDTYRKTFCRRPRTPDIDDEGFTRVSYKSGVPNEVNEHVSKVPIQGQERCCQY